MSCARLSAFVLAAVVADAGVAFACSSSPTILPVKEAQGCTLQIVGVTVIASKQINPAPDGAPRPVQVRLYQLKTDTRMLNASFDRIWKDDKGTLQDDLVKVDEFPVYPDSRTEVKFERDPAALYVVGVALFREPKGRNWWTEFELPPAPGKGTCGVVEPKCNGPNCPQEGGAPVLAPRYAIWIDGTRVDDGSDHLDEYPDPNRVTTLTLHSSAPAPAPAGDAGK